MLKRKLVNQGFLVVKLKSSLRQFYGRHHDLVIIITVTEYLCHKLTLIICSVGLSLSQSDPFLIHDLSPSLYQE